ncbi:Exocyst complex component SEC3A [Glycine soja]
MTDLDGNIVDVPNPGGRGPGYRYFGAAKKLPGVKELFKKPPELRRRRTRYDIYKRIDASYYGYRDEEDGVLARLEELVEEAMRREAAAEEWRRLDEVRREARKGVVSGEMAEVTAVAREVLKEDEEEVVEEERARERREFVVHVPLPDEMEIERRVLEKKKKDLLSRYASEGLVEEQTEAKDMLNIQLLFSISNFVKLLCLQPAKLYKLKHLSKVEVVANDPSGCTFTLIETRNNNLEMQSVNNKSLIEELDKLLERLRVPSEYATNLTGGSFDEARMLQNVEACEWLTSALRGLGVPNLDPSYANMRAVKEKRAELEKLKSTFVRRASEFLRNYFASLVDFMISDKSYFSQRGQLKRPDHADLRYKCRTYARLLQHLKSLDKNCLGPLRKAYCSSLNLLLRREAREFANELRASTKASRNPTVWLEGSTGSGQNVNATDTSTVSDAYAKMLTIFIPLLVDESSFFAHFMCFEVPTLVPPGGVVNGNKAGYDDDDDLGIMDIDENDSKSGKNSAELEALNKSLKDLLDGIQEDFYAVVDWAYKIDPLRCISMHGMTERYLSGQKADAAGFVRDLLRDLESRISMQFNRFVDEACHQIERNERNVRQMGVLSYIPSCLIPFQPVIQSLEQTEKE